MRRKIYRFFTAMAVVSVFLIFSSCDDGARESWNWKSSTRVDNYPDIKRTIWEMERAPHGPFDKIALVRTVKDRDSQKTWTMGHKNVKKVIFIIPGTWDRADVSSSDDRTSLDLFLANHGYDVYSMNFRTFYIPNYAYNQFETYGIDISSTADWTYGVFREDIKTCVEAAKKISGAKKVFLAGRSRGGTQMFIYASKYPDDLKGLISLDGGGKVMPLSGTKMTEEAYEAFVASFKATGKLLTEVGGYETLQYAGIIPYSQTALGFASLQDAYNYYKSIIGVPVPSGFSIDVYSDIVAYNAYWQWGKGGVTNYYGGFIDRNVLIHTLSILTRYWPAIQDIEGSQMNAYGNCPFLDYDDNLANLPLIAFLSDLFCPHGACLALPNNKTLSSDATFVYLPGFGHLDVYAGKFSYEKISKPLLEWMNARL
jgi:pimeloyl-ACP methyl ester carboxylesterase